MSADGRAANHAVLIHSPFTTAASWGDLPRAMRDLGWDVTVTDVIDDDPPYLSRFVALTTQQLQRAGVGSGAVLIGHSAAGPLLPQVAFARHAQAMPVGGYVFVDAMLPRTLRTGTLLDVIEASDPVAAAELTQRLSDGQAFPDWADSDLADQIPDPSERALLLANLRPRRLDFFTERLPLAEDWPDAPCAYVQLSDAFAPEAHTARLRGWPVRSVAAHHFWAMTHPSELADLLVEVTSH